MKRMLSVLIAGGLLLSLAACQSSGTPGEAGGPANSPPSAAPVEKPAAPEEASAAPEDAADGAQRLMEEYWAAAGTDYEAFAALFRNTDEDTVQSEFSSGTAVSQYDSMVCIPVVSSGPYHLMHFTYYIVTGVYPDTHMDATHLNAAFSLVDGVWKFEYSQEAVNALSEQLDTNRTLYPAEGLAAFEAGRNWCVFSGDNYMYLDSGAVFQGCNYVEVKFAWQDEEGNLCLSLWMANGTDTNRFNKTMDLIITDSALGVIADVSGVELGAPVKALSGTLYPVTIPAAQLKTGTQTWSGVSTSLDCRTD